MRPLTIELDGQVAGLPADTRRLLQFTSGTAALADLDVRRGEYAFPLTLPDCRANAAIFGSRLHPQTADKFARTWACVVRCGGAEWRGVFRLTSLKQGYTGTLQLPGFAWADQLKGKTLRDLPTSVLPAVPYDGTELETILAMDCDQTNLQFPLVVFGNFFAPPLTESDGNGGTVEKPRPASTVISYPLSVDDYLPSVYYRNVVRAVFRAAGYTVVGKPLDHPEVRQWCITAAGAKPDEFWPWGALLPAESTNADLYHFSNYRLSGADQGEFANTAHAFDTSTGFRVMYFALRGTAISGGTRALNPATAIYTAPRAGSYSFAWSATVVGGAQAWVGSLPDFRETFGGLYVALVAFRGDSYDGADGGLIATGAPAAGNQRILSFATIGDFDSINTGAYSGVNADVYLEPGESVQLVLLGLREAVNDLDGNVVIYRSSFSISFSGVSLACTAYDGPLLLEPAKVLPALPQVDLVRDLLIRTNSLLVTDPDRKLVTLTYREDYIQAQGPPVELTELVERGGVEFTPPVGGASALSFGPANMDEATVAVKDRADALAPLDTVTVELQGGGAAKVVKGVFAAVGSRGYQHPGGQSYPIPTVASEEALKKPVSESSPTDGAESAAPRVVVMKGISAAPIPFQQRQVYYGVAEYAGTSLAWEGPTGAVATWYAQEVQHAYKGHEGKASVYLTPAVYKDLTPGRLVHLHGGTYTVEEVRFHDPVDEEEDTEIILKSIL